MYFNTCRLNYDFEMNRHKTDKKRKYCNHCDDYVSMRTYFRHKVYVDRPRNTDDSLAVDDSESDEQSEIGKEDKMLAPSDIKDQGVDSTNDKKPETDNAAGTVSETTETDGSKVKVVYKFCDLMKSMIAAWKEQFKEYIPDRVQVYSGDIFKSGPAADAIVSPANSFGFMDGGIDMAYSRHFGWQMQDRLQEVIREKHRGELLVGDAIIIPTVEGKEYEGSVDWSKFNEGQPIKYLISAPTMRVPLEVNNTANAYLAFRAIILAVEKHNSTPGNDPIRSVLCPGLGTAVGRMPADRCAYQMLQAFETYELGLWSDRVFPKDLGGPWEDHVNMSEMLIAFETYEKGLHKERIYPKDLASMLTDNYKLVHYGESEEDRLLKFTGKFYKKQDKTDKTKKDTVKTKTKDGSGDAVENKD